jgi:hypothetical protein
MLRGVGGTDDPDPCPKEIASGRGRLVWWAGRKEQLARRIRVASARAQPVTWLTLSSLSAKQNEFSHGGFFPIGQCWGRWLSERQPAAFPWW